MSTQIIENPRNTCRRGKFFPESARTFRTVFETMASAIFIYRGKSLRYANWTAEVITGYNAKRTRFRETCSASVAELSIQPRDMAAMSLLSSCRRQSPRP